MRNISFALTTPQVRNRTKTVTRRNGWAFLKPGDLLQAVEKSQGLKKGEHPVKIAVIRVLSVDVEPLAWIRVRQGDCAKEGFPDWTPHQFIEFYCQHNKCNELYPVRRIQFEYVDEALKGE